MVPIVISVLALLVSVGTAVHTFRRNVQADIRGLLTELTSTDAAAARTRIATAAHDEELTGKDISDAQIRQDVFLLLWRIQRLALHRKVIQGTALVVDETALLYQHLEHINTDINIVFKRRAHLTGFDESVQLANAAIQGLPDVRDSWEVKVRAAPRILLAFNGIEPQPSTPLPTLLELLCTPSTFLARAIVVRLRRWNLWLRTRLSRRLPR
ncbi:hypothetical protein [Luteipulveratus mongoliensis]|uniref:Uncharacterized protein n=1 Tax=Luteipulveratus mongoliensis TaxID=571913 RepID=A0A0K1JDJ3_9MICO|nr:hypothetical protein [Luteipulveratus mongoliensis]AKU14764.1 hypothetical protein VV02_00850 [Luteipulveratus mongoliensis]